MNCGPPRVASSLLAPSTPAAGAGGMTAPKPVQGAARCPPTMRAAILDFDGVIAHSMEHHAEAYRRVLAPHGIQVEDRDVFLWEGARSESILREFLSRSGPPDDALVGRLADEKQRVFRDVAKDELYDGARDMVRRIRAGADRLGLVTGTRRENLERIIPDLLPQFDAVLAQDSYSHDKPHPEPYEKAAVELEARPQDCVVVENAPRGIRSAKAAGCGHVVAVCTTLRPDDLRDAGPDTVAEDHAAATEAVLAWLERRGS